MRKYDREEIDFEEGASRRIDADLFELIEHYHDTRQWWSKFLIMHVRWFLRHRRRMLRKQRG